MMTSSADFFGNFGCGSTGMPRPLSVTVRKPSADSSTSMKVGVARQRLVHGVVDDFGEQVMQRLLVGAADIHAGPAPDRLQPLQHLDVARGVAGFGAAAARGHLQVRLGVPLGFRLGAAKQVVFFGFRR